MIVLFRIGIVTEIKIIPINFNYPIIIYIIYLVETSNL